MAQVSEQSSGGLLFSGRCLIVNGWDELFQRISEPQSVGKEGLLRTSFSSESVIQGRQLNHIRKTSLASVFSVWQGSRIKGNGILGESGVMRQTESWKYPQTGCEEPGFWSCVCWLGVQPGASPPGFTITLTLTVPLLFLSCTSVYCQVY